MYFRLLFLIHPLPKPLKYLAVYFVDYIFLSITIHTARFHSVLNLKVRNYDIRLTYSHGAIYLVFGSRIQTLYQHFMRFVVRSDDQLNKRYGRSAAGKTTIA